MNEKDINHLEWVFERMIYVHNENRNIDYMIRFKEVIEQLRQYNVSGRSEQLCGNLDENYKCKNMCLSRCFEGNKFYK